MLFDVTNSQGTKHYRSSLSVNRADVPSRHEPNKEYVEKNNAVLFSSDLLSSNLSNDLSELFKRKQKDLLLNYLQLFDARINAIDILNNDVYIGYSDIREMLPVSLSSTTIRCLLPATRRAAPSATSTSNKNCWLRLIRLVSAHSSAVNIWLMTYA